VDAVEVEMVCFNTKAVSPIFSFLAETDAAWTRRLVLFSLILARPVAIFLLSRDHHSKRVEVVPLDSLKRLGCSFGLRQPLSWMKAN